MKNLKHISEFLKIYESHDESTLFFDEEGLKKILLKDKNFAKGEVYNAIMNIAYDEWQKHQNWTYDQTLSWINQNFGTLPFFITLFGSYDGQVCNGGHFQYYENGYASSDSHGFTGTYKDIEKHENLVEIFKELDLDSILPSGKIVYDIISRFQLDLDDEIEVCSECDGNGTVDCTECDGNGSTDCKRCGGDGEDEDGEQCEECDGDGSIECEECKGNGYITCEDCDGKGEVETGYEVPDKSEWERLDTEWYKVNVKFINEFNEYLKTLTLEGEKISDLVELAEQSQKYNL